MTGHWAPIQEAHSIEIVGASVALSQPMGDILHKRVLRVAEPLAGTSGLVNQLPSGNTLQVLIGPGGVPQMTQGPAGISFQRLELLGQPDGSYQSQPVEELAVERPSITFRARAYTRWPQFQEKLDVLFSPLLALILSVEAVASVRLEYRDRFLFDGDLNDAPVGTALRLGSPFIAPHVFDRTDLWHSYTGMFLPPDTGAEKRLVQVTIDANNLMMADRSERRTIGIMTAVQDNLSLNDDAADVGQLSRDLLARFDRLHEASIGFFGEIISDEMKKRVGLAS